jgi:hypothetical protein
MKIISIITDPSVVRRFLEHVGLPSAHPLPEPARAPPDPEFDGDAVPEDEPVFDDPAS